jgi:DNA-binding MarR family transcriptional regulator
MTKLTDTQLIVLTAAAARDDGSILPLPKTIRGGAVTKVVDALTAKGLVERIVDDRPAVDDVLKITREGLLAINADPDEGVQAADVGQSAEPAPSARRSRKKAATAPDTPKEPRKRREGTKQAVLIDMLKRDEGATIDQIVEATGWQRHTVRGAISGALKKKLGLTVTSEKVEGTRVYRIPA